MFGACRQLIRQAVCVCLDRGEKQEAGREFGGKLHAAPHPWRSPDLRTRCTSCWRCTLSYRHSNQTVFLAPTARLSSGPADSVHANAPQKLIGQRFPFKNAVKLRLTVINFICEIRENVEKLILMSRTYIVFKYIHEKRLQKVNLFFASFHNSPRGMIKIKMIYAKFTNRTKQKTVWNSKVESCTSGTWMLQHLQRGQEVVGVRFLRIGEHLPMRGTADFDTFDTRRCMRKELDA